MKMAVGYQRVDLADPDLHGLSLPMAVLYPTSSPPTTVQVGPYTMEVAADAAPREGCWPLVMISHGTGGSHLVYRDLAHFLASSGFVVGMPEHPFNNRRDNSWEGTLANLTHRPRHLRAAVDWLLSSPTFGRFLQPTRYAAIGHSMGGYTVLAAAGGVPTGMAHEAPDRLPHRLEVGLDPRLQAAVLLAPASVWFREPGAFSGVKARILMLVGAEDDITPADYHAQVILRGVPDPDQVRYRLVEGAGHFAFLSPFPVAMAEPAFAPAQDPPGFSRAAFHRDLHAEVYDFLLGAGFSPPLV